MEDLDLMEEIRDFFKSVYDGIEDSESFLSFENIGLAINGNEFTDFEGNISEEKALEQLSMMADQLPEIKNKFYTDTSSLRSVYNLLLDSARFNSNLNPEDTQPIFESRISDARRKLEQFSKISIETPFGDFLPVYPSVKQWFNIESSVWTKQEFKVRETDRNASKTSSKKSPITMPLAWRTSFLANPISLKTITHKSVVESKKNIISSEMLMHKNVTKTGTTLTEVKLNPNALKFKKGAREHALKLRKKHQELSKKDLVQWNDFKPLIHLDIADRFILTNQIAKVDEAELKPVESNHLSISFEYSIVKLHRPWMENILFDISNLWYSLTHSAGHYSNGKKDKSNKGILKCYTSAMILIKNIEISAAWTNKDKENAKNCMALANFNLTESTFTNNKIKSEGIQIFGWMCNVLPKLPAISCPSKEN